MEHYHQLPETIRHPFKAISKALGDWALRDVDYTHPLDTPIQPVTELPGQLELPYK